VYSREHANRRMPPMRSDTVTFMYGATERLLCAASSGALSVRISIASVRHAARDL